MKTYYCYLYQSFFLLLWFIVIQLVALPCNAQKGLYPKQTWNSLQEDVIKNEISTFNKTAGSQAGQKTTQLKQVRRVSCTDTSAVFDNAFFSADLFVKIIARNINGKKQIKEMVVIRDTKRVYQFYEAAFNDVDDPVFAYDSNNKRECDCRVYRSKDHHRLYIYMVNGYDDHRYEITWIVQDGVLYKRIVDKLPQLTGA